MASAISSRTKSLESLIAGSQCNKARLLHYFPEEPTSSEPSSSSSSRVANDALCGTHVDHSLLTGLCTFSSLLLSLLMGNQVRLCTLHHLPRLPHNPHPYLPPQRPLDCTSTPDTILHSLGQKSSKCKYRPTASVRPIFLLPLIAHAYGSSLPDGRGTRAAHGWTTRSYTAFRQRECRADARGKRSLKRDVCVLPPVSLGLPPCLEA